MNRQIPKSYCYTSEMLSRYLTNNSFMAILSSNDIWSSYFVIKIF